MILIQIFKESKESGAVMVNRNITPLIYENRKAADRSLKEILVNHIDKQGIPGFIYLSPTRRKNREIENSIQKIRPFWKGLFFTPPGLANHIVSVQSHGSRSAGEDLKRFLALEILEEGRRSGEMEGLAPLDKPVSPGLATHFLSAMDRLISLKPETGPPAPDLRAPNNGDLERFMERFNQRLEDLGLINPASMNNMASDLLDQSSLDLGRDIDLVVLDGFTDLKPDERALLVRLAQALKGARIILTLPAPLLRALERNGWRDLPSGLKIYEELRPLLDDLGLDPRQADLLEAEPGCAAENLEEKVSIESFQDRVGEVKAIAGRIKSIFARSQKDHIEPEDFHVAVPSLEPYYRLFIEIFPTYGIPFNITRGIPLLSIPVVGLLKTMLRTIMKRDYKSVFDLFSSNLITVPPVLDQSGFESFVQSRLGLNGCLTGILTGPEQLGSDPPALDPGFIDSMARNFKVTGGLDFERDWLTPFIKAMAPHMKRTEGSIGSEPSEKALNLFRRILPQLWLLQHEFESMDRCLGAESMVDLAQEFTELAQRWRVPANLYQSLAIIDSETDVAREIVFEKNVKGLNRALELVHETAHDLELVGRKEADPKIFEEIITHIWAKEMIQEAGELEGVSVSQMLEIRNISKNHLFLAGLTSDSFPLSVSSNFLLPTGPNSREFNNRLNLSNNLLDQALTNNGRIYLSHPQSDHGDHLGPSIALEDLIEKYPSSVGECESWTLEGPFSRREALERAASVWAMADPVNWEDLRSSLESIPLAQSPDAHMAFHHEIRSLLIASIRRGQRFEPGPYDGIIEDPEVLRAIRSKYEDPGFYYSPKSLNAFSNCPFSFFLENILGLIPARDAAEELESAEIGSIVHEILARFYERLPENGMERVTPANRIDSLKLMGDTAKNLLQEKPGFDNDNIHAATVREQILRGLIFEETDGDEIERIRRHEDLRRSRRGKLRAVIDHDAGLDLPLKPVRTEFEFGADRKRRLEIRAGGRKIKIRGRMDRIDQSIGPDHSEKILWVYDYKTYGAQSLNATKSGEDLQLPIYLMAALEAYGDEPPSAAGVCFLELDPKMEDLRNSVIYTPGIAGELIEGLNRRSWECGPKDLENFRERIRNIDLSIRSGRFPRASKASNCGPCAFRNLCFRDEHRLKAMDTGVS